MKHIKKISHLALFIISLVFIAPTQAAVFEIQRVASTDSLNLRAKPGARNAIVGRVPHNGKWIRTDGRRVAVGRTQWIKINWRGRVGWVNERYVRQMVLNKAPQPTTVAPTTTPQAPRPAAAPTPPPLPPSLSVAALHKKGAWVLECGNKSPFWRVIVHPGKALEVNLR
ncbi:MAG: SH3 domain-containing protein, partial [Leucothrix sp.]